MDLNYTTPVNVLTTFKIVKSEMELMYRKVVFVRKPKLINVIPHRKFCEIKKYMVKVHTNLGFAH